MTYLPPTDLEPALGISMGAQTRGLPLSGPAVAAPWQSVAGHRW
jgi:hypothetical protein